MKDLFKKIIAFIRDLFGVSDEEDSGSVTPRRPSTPRGTKTVNKTITVRGTFNGENKLYKAGSSLGDGSQAEGQKPIFILKAGATLTDTYWQGADGVHVEASDGKTTRILDCECHDVGEDAITIKSGDNDAKVLIDGFRAWKASDKVIQVNAKPVLTLRNVYAENFLTFCRTNGGGPNLSYRIELVNGTFVKGRRIIYMSNSKARATVHKSNVAMSDVRSPYEAKNGAKISMI